MDKKLAMFYRREVLEKGGTADENELLEKLLGRPPQVDALLDELNE